MKKNFWGLIGLFIAATVVFAPLMLYALKHMDVFMGRSDFLFIGHKIAKTGSLQPLWENIAKNLLTLYYKAKVGNFFNNEIPIISRILAFFATIGCAYHLRYVSKRGSLFVILAFAFGMLSSVSKIGFASSNGLPDISLSLEAQDSASLIVGTILVVQSL